MPERQATDRVRREWSLRVHAEYTSAAHTQHLTLWVVQLALSPDLIRAGLAITDDELAHAELSHSVCIAAGAHGIEQVRRDTLGLPRSGGELEVDLVRACLRSFCINETLAVRLFAAMREDCDVPIARAGLDRIVRDEVRHRDFGWALLDALLATVGPVVEEIVAEELQPMLAERRALCERMRARTDPPLTPGERAWGLLDPRAYLGVFEDALERDIRPRLAERGLAAALDRARALR